MVENNWIKIVEAPTKEGVRQKYQVYNKVRDNNIGVIMWHDNSERYVYMPENICVFDNRSLELISEFLKTIEQ